MNKIVHPASTRGTVSFGWLNAKYSFSFGNYFDPNRIQFGALRVLNDDTIAPAMGFGKHPHQNMEIITIPQSGALKHKDSMGNEGIVKAGDIQVMSAGSGIEHSEINASASEELTLFQIWIFSEQNNVTPRYDQKEIAPLLKPNQLTTIVKPKDKATKDDIWIHQQAYISIGDFSAQQTITYSLQNTTHGIYILTVEGSIKVADETLEKRDAIGLWNTNEVIIEVTKDTRVLVIEIPMN